VRDIEFAIHNMQETLLDQLDELELDRLGGEQALHLCDLSRRIGCGCFFTEGDERPLFEGLYRSADIYLHFLSTLQSRGIAGEAARGQSAPMTDALAAGQLHLAREIDALLPAQQVPDLEDDEDFAWYSAFHALGVGRLEGKQLAATADGLLATDSDFLAPRGTLLKAIAGRDAKAFRKALAQLTESWHDNIEEARGSGITDIGADLTEWNLFIEGAALVRAARDRGVAVKRFYPHIPSELLGEPPADLGED
jgi:hypothetical protein